MRGVGGEERHVAHLVPAPDPHEIDRVKQAAGLADRFATGANAPGWLTRRTRRMALKEAEGCTCGECPVAERHVARSMRHRPRRVPDLEQPDLSEVDVREGVRHERIEAGLVDLDVEDAAAAGRHLHGLHAVLRRARDVRVRPGSVEDRARRRGSRCRASALRRRPRGERSGRDRRSADA